MTDLRSDTVTRPTPGMLEAMIGAEVGDDVFGEDPSINALQEKAAALFGMEGALFCPSGTMTNQIGMKVHTRPGDEVICHELSHVYLYEGGGIAVNSGASVRTLRGEHGKFGAGDVRAAVNDRDDPHLPYSHLVVVENTVNKGGGSCWDLDEIRAIRAVCEEEGLALHLDGARLFHALVATGQSATEYGPLFDTISICLSKGLGAPVGSLLLGGREEMARAHRYRKVMGGGMRQAGYLAAAGIYALDHHVERLAEDHAKAQAFGDELQRLSYIDDVLPVETNIVIFRIGSGFATEDFLAHLRGRGVLALSLNPPTIRCVFHLDVTEAGFERVIEAVRSFP